MLRNQWLISVSALLAGALLGSCGDAKAKPKEHVIYSFAGGANDGANPIAGLVMDAKGNFYGTTYGGGPVNGGTVFELAKDGTETMLFSFDGGKDGGEPAASLTMDNKGNLYGTTAHGGATIPNGGKDNGVVFGFGFPFDDTLDFLHDFLGVPDGDDPISRLLITALGAPPTPGAPRLAIYGTTNLGGMDCDGSGLGCGTIFKLVIKGKKQKEKILYRFSGGKGGAYPFAGLISDKDGNLYGTTGSGGDTTCTGGCGVVFELTPKGKLKVLHAFAGGANGDGAKPFGDLIADPAGNLYGVTYVGGAHGDGTVFKIEPSGKESVLYSFAGGSDGLSPYAGLLMDKTGNLYGTTYLGGDGGKGVVFKLTRDGDETVLHSFGLGGDGAYPQSILIMDAGGNLYGTTQYGGASNNGTVFEVTQ